ncbi:uncharacterized protein [Epargyreus clarus]|uniref:uncharacterized protein n=1 Tax=Epargyreus clarus TaxID=520877 RepID=UPI003C2C2FF9
MIRALLIFCAISRAQLEMQSFQHQMYVSRKSRANSNPIQTGYVYSRVSDGPGLMTTFDNSYVKSTESQTTATTAKDFERPNITSTLGAREYQDNATKYQDYKTTGSEIKNGVTVSTPKQNEERMKAETKYIQEKDQDIEAINQHLKSIIPGENTVKEMFMNYDSDKFKIDDEDVRTDSTNIYNGWPYSYHGPYEYQIKKGETEKEKANDKRVLLGADTSIIPVHENLDNDIPYNPIRPRANSANNNGATTDNPIYGNQPFFSFVLNDYFDRSNEEYPLIFKDFSWGEEFDHGVPYQDIDDSGRNRRLEDNKHPKKRQQIGYLGKKMYGTGQTVTEKTYDSNKGYDEYKKGDESYDHQALEHGHKRQHQIGFKDFVDAFANLFGSENSEKESKFMLNQNQNKGEKKKGFRRVYHKDEYQEDNEFYDNTNKKAQAKEIGGMKSNHGRSQAVLRSHAVANMGNNANSLTKESNTEKQNENNNKASERHDINRYRNIAKNAAQSNSADYIDQYGI